MTITKRDLTKTISTRTKIRPATTKHIIDALFKLMGEELCDCNRIEIRGFGSFNVHRTPARNAHNPATREPIQVPSRLRLSFKPGLTLTKALRA